jgi:hypothetical protein
VALAVRRRSMTRRRVRKVVVMSAIFASMSTGKLDNLGMRDERPKLTIDRDDTRRVALTLSAVRAFY